jgi:hypothetical protein
MAAVFLLTGTMTFLLGVTKGYWMVLIVFAQPMLAVCFFPAGFAALSCIGPSSSRNVAVSLTIPLAFLIGAGAILLLVSLWWGYLSLWASCYPSPCNYPQKMNAQLHFSKSRGNVVRFFEFR